LFRPTRRDIIRAEVRVWASDNTSQPGGTATSEFRIGLGEDSHRLSEPVGGPLRLGGIDIPHDRRLIGHSDADVLLHAVTDALLGALALPDIGQQFPDSQQENRGRDSAEMLSAAANQLAAKGYQVVNLDCVIRAQRPKIADYKEAIRHSIAGILSINPHQVGLKAKTGEHVGPVGREEAIEARCVALLAKSE
jgi:2-C-methyl-D-erythritol 2,4-cyclodiphosphate synthase